MKTTKTVEITICDICGKEKMHQELSCSRCGKDICDYCVESFRIEMYHRSKVKTSQFGMDSYSNNHINLGANERICSQCAVVIMAGWNALGLIGKPREEVDKFMAVLD